MGYLLLAEAVVLLHFLFVLFALFGAALALKWRKAVWLHLPAALWAMLLEFANLECPLTPLEKWLIERQGLAAYRGSFLEHHILSILYPGPLGESVRIALGLTVLLLNLLLYGLVLRKNREKVLK